VTALRYTLRQDGARWIVQDELPGGVVIERLHVAEDRVPELRALVSELEHAIKARKRTEAGL